MTRRRAPLAARARRLAPALALLLALLPVGCALEHRTGGRALPDDATLAALRPGESTVHDALELLGAPLSVRRTFDGELYLWRRSESHASRLLLVPLFPIYERTRGQGGSDRLALLFDADGVLAAVGLRRETRSGRAAETADDARDAAADDTADDTAPAASPAP